MAAPVRHSKLQQNKDVHMKVIWCDFLHETKSNYCSKITKPEEMTSLLTGLA